MAVGKRITPVTRTATERIADLNFDGSASAIDSLVYQHLEVTTAGTFTVSGDQPIHVRNNTGSLITVGGVAINDQETATLIGSGNTRTKFGS